MHVTTQTHFHTGKPLLRFTKEKGLCLESRMIGLVTLVFFLYFAGLGSGSSCLKSYLSFGGSICVTKISCYLAQNASQTDSKQHFVPLCEI